MLKTCLFVLIFSLQAALGLNLAIGNHDSASGYDSRPVAPANRYNYSNKQVVEEVDYLGKIKDLGITIHPGKEYAKDSFDNPFSQKKCASLVYRALKAMPTDTVSKIKNLTLYFNSTGRRGLGGGSTVILRCQNVTDEELVSVLVHELGHIEDTGVLRGDSWSGESEFMDGKAVIYENDSSLGFYRISFSNDYSVKKSAKDLDFVSGYAMTDPFEDFAETYNFYVLHGDSFREMLLENAALKKKYNFMKNVVFAGKEYSNDQVPSLNIADSRNYDTTVLGFDLNKFLAYS